MTNHLLTAISNSPHSATSGFARSTEKDDRGRRNPDQETPKRPFDAQQWAAVRPVDESLASTKARQLVGKAGLKATVQDDIKQQLLLYVIERLHAHERSGWDTGGVHLYADYNCCRFAAP